MYIAYYIKRVIILQIVNFQFFSQVVKDLETNILEDHYKGTHTFKSWASF